MKESPEHHRTFQAVRAALEGPERESAVAHLAECGECAEMLAGVCAAVAVHGTPRPRPMEPARAERVRSRLLARAREGASWGAPSVPTARRPGVAAAGGWLVAAGLASLLLTHHSFHRPLSLGWVAAALMGIALFGAGVYIWVQRRRLAALERDVALLRGPPRR